MIFCGKDIQDGDAQSALTVFEAVADIWCELTFRSKPLYQYNDKELKNYRFTTGS